MKKYVCCLVVMLVSAACSTPVIIDRPQDVDTLLRHIDREICFPHRIGNETKYVCIRKAE